MPSSAAKRIAAFKEKLATLSSARSSSNPSSSSISNSQEESTGSLDNTKNKEKKRKTKKQKTHKEVDPSFPVGDTKYLPERQLTEKENRDHINVLKSFRKHFEKNIHSNSHSRGLFSQRKRSRKLSTNKQKEINSRHHFHTDKTKINSKRSITRNKPDFSDNYFENVQQRLKKRRKNTDTKMRELDKITKLFSDDFFRYSSILEKESSVVQETTYMLENAAKRLDDVVDEMKSNTFSLNVSQNKNVDEESYTNRRDNIDEIPIENNLLESQSGLNSQSMEFSSQNTEFLTETQPNSQLLFNEEDWDNSNNFN